MISVLRALVFFIGVVVLGGCSPAPSSALTVSDAWAPVTPPGVSIGAGYLKITNGTAKVVRLTGGASAAAESVEIHSMSMDGGVMRMRPMTEGVEVPPGASIELSPGGMHLMLVGLKAPLTEGMNVPLTLSFEGAEPAAVQLTVKAPGGHGH